MKSQSELVELWNRKAAVVRKWCLISTTAAGSGHPTSCLSAVDITTVLFDKYIKYDLKNPLNSNNDRFVLSKGHAAPLLYTLFGVAGAYPLEELKTLRKFGSRFQGHPVPDFKFTEAATGSLGQGLSVAAGLALLAKRENKTFKTFALLGDGELSEGQNWEAANFASYHQLDNLIAIADINRLAQSGETMFGHNLVSYENRFRAFGFKVITIDGHDMLACDQALQTAVANNDGSPTIIIMKTYKGKGVSFLENSDQWHGKGLDNEQLKNALEEIGNVDDQLKFELKRVHVTEGETLKNDDVSLDFSFNPGEKTSLRKVFGEFLAGLGKQRSDLWVLDADVKNSTYTEKFCETLPERFVECFIAEQNMVSAAVGLSRLGKVPFVVTFGAFLTRAADQIRMARVSNANIKFIGTHVGVSIGEDGPSQMALEDIALFGAIPDTIILQPADAMAVTKLMPLTLMHEGFSYMRILRPETPIIYSNLDEFRIGGSKVLRKTSNDLLTIVATGITVFEALKAADSLEADGIHVRVVDCYSINPIDKKTLNNCLKETERPIIISIEDHFAHGGMGDFIGSALNGTINSKIIKKMAVEKISRSGSMDKLLGDAGISYLHLVEEVKKYS
ncbi:transketolase [Fulvivirga ligni]|uniref:transketolase n=1 Tax=Fulvivirga ligni TaxID=2904246 RepID=UPI001F36A778|nr:transketolase [Fulvivirga ligni]UII20792.1 transketolase [Fulvivirga ligni]